MRATLKFTLSAGVRFVAVATFVLGRVPVESSDGVVLAQSPPGEAGKGTAGALYGAAHQFGSSGAGCLEQSDGTPCNDNNACTQDDACASGVCIGGSPTVCTASDQCHDVGTCDPSTGCSNPPKPNGALCDDGDACLLGDTCQTTESSAFPYAGLIQGTDGALYGTTREAGLYGFGTVFKLNSDGTGFTVLTQFDNTSTGAYPQARLIQGTDGALYGAAYQGGNSGYGTVFKLNTDGSGFIVLKHFDRSSTGRYLSGGPIQGTDGALYGTAYQGGSSGYGTVFKLSTDGSVFSVLKNFDFSSSGGYPLGGLIQGTDGALYGTAHEGGSLHNGTVFKLNTDGSGFSVLQSFDHFSTGGSPYAGLTQGTDGALYGTTFRGGNSNVGTVFRLNTDGSGFSALKHFDLGSSGGSLYAGVIQGTDGTLYGTAHRGGNSGIGTVFKLNTDGSGFAVLQHFELSGTGFQPSAALLQGTDGTLYGTARAGGSEGAGTVFSLNPDGTGFTVLKNLQYLSITTCAGPNALDCDDGIPCTDDSCYPGSGCVNTIRTCYPSDQCHAAGTCDPKTGVCSDPEQADGTPCSDGNPCTQEEACVSGACSGGSPTVCTALDQCHDPGTCELSTGCSNPVRPNGTSCDDGNECLLGDTCQTVESSAFPTARLIQGTDGALYGTASHGGIYNYGTVFKLNPNGTGFTVLKSFDNSGTGGYPYSGVIQGTDGALYGTAPQGGSLGYGTLFRLNTDGSGFSVLKQFDGFGSGGYAQAGLVQGTDGALYGAAASGGSQGYGTVFKLNTDGTGFTVLQNLSSFSTGGAPYGRLIQGTDGALYGTAYQGGNQSFGTVFKLNTDGSGFTVLQNLNHYATGGYLQAGVIQGTDGVLYGAAQDGGSQGGGTLFRLNTDGSGFGVLANFNFSDTGHYPFDGLIQATDGALYGTTYQGGIAGTGTVFKLNPDGSDFSVVQNFNYSGTGSYPYAGLLQGSDGALYGTAIQGGDFSYGTVFRLNTDGTGFSAIKSFNLQSITSCAGADTLNCDDELLCTADSCNPASGCDHTSTVCFASDQCHAAGSCDPQTGACSNPELPNGTSCDDGDLCTTPDACTAGSCVGTPGTVPGEVGTVATSKAGAVVLFDWSSPPGATAHDLLRGQVQNWPVGSSPATETCLTGSVLGSNASDAAVPLAGGGFWYLVRAGNACGSGSYGSAASHGVPTAPRLSGTCP